MLVHTYQCFVTAATGHFRDLPDAFGLRSDLEVNLMCRFALPLPVYLSHSLSNLPLHRGAREHPSTFLKPPSSSSSSRIAPSGLCWTIVDEDSMSRQLPHITLGTSSKYPHAITRNTKILTDFKSNVSTCAECWILEEADLKVATCIAEVGGIEVPHDDIILKDIILKDIQVCFALLSILL